MKNEWSVQKDSETPKWLVVDSGEVALYRRNGPVLFRSQATAQKKADSLNKKRLRIEDIDNAECDKHTADIDSLYGNKFGNCGS
jgi:hypothetical protein